MAVSLIDRGIVVRNAPTVPSTILLEDPLRVMVGLCLQVNLELRLLLQQGQMAELNVAVILEGLRQRLRLPQLWFFVDE